jgi:peptidoglycan/xylan/chitin deacetylase (PgdA/CDA1 family)
MIVSNTTSLLWQHIPADISERVTDILNRYPGTTVFFRADDIAIPSARQNRLLELFAQHDAPLCAAIVPAWINRSRWQNICRHVRGKHRLFAWHQHGWIHHNHETAGKKQEFGPGASYQRKRRDILRGRDKLTDILGGHFLPVFTPPWNRLDLDTMHILKELGFRAISRYRGDRLPTLPGLPDLSVNVDLHTRREDSAEAGWAGLLTELDQALATGVAGLMIHHQRMNDAAFAFLDALLPWLRAHPGIRMCHYGDLLEVCFPAPS